MTSPSRFTFEEIDPEDRIFDSPTSSESFPDSHSEDHQDDTISAHQRLLLSLQQSVEDIRANVIQLTRRNPLNRPPSQVSTISSHLDSISRSLGTIRQHYHSNTQPFPTGLTMDRPTNPPPPEDMSNDELELWVRQLSTEVYRGRNMPTSLRRETGNEAYFQFTDGELQRARRILQRRRGATSVFGTREEVQRQGHDYRSPLTTLFARPASEQTQAQGRVSSNADPLSHTTQQVHSSTDSSGGPPGSGHYDLGAPTSISLPSEQGAQSQIAHQYLPILGYRELPSGSERNSIEGLEASGPSVPQTQFDRIGPYTPVLSEQSPQESAGARNSLRAPSLRPPPQEMDGTSSQTRQPHLPFPSLPSTDRIESSAWRRLNSDMSQIASARQRLAEARLRFPTHDPQQISPQGRVAGASIGTRSHYQAASGHVPTPSSINDLGIWGMPTTPLEPTLWDGARREGTEIPDFDPSLAGEHRVWSRNVPTEQELRRQQRPKPPQPNLDTDSTRPEPVADEDMLVSMHCKICFAQISNQAVLPCG